MFAAFQLFSFAFLTAISLLPRDQFMLDILKYLNSECFRVALKLFYFIMLHNLNLVLCPQVMAAFYTQWSVQQSETLRSIFVTWGPCIWFITCTINQDLYI